MRKSITQEVAENIGAILGEKGTLQILSIKLIEARLGDFFRPIVRQAIAEALGIEPEMIGPELIEEGLQDSITAAYLAKQWLEEKKIPEIISHLREQHGNEFSGFENETAVRQIALNLLIVRDKEIILANAVRDKLLTKK